MTVGWKAPEGFVPKALAWHPRVECLFLMGVHGTQNHILRLEKGLDGWNARKIFESPNELRRMVVGPSPFGVYPDAGQEEEGLFYRLFFGTKNPDGTYRIVSITENGKRFYQVIGPAKTFTHFKGVPEPPSVLEAVSALPMTFHPAGHELVWEDGQHNFHLAGYESKFWGKATSPLEGGKLKGGTVTPTPNGLGWLHWTSSSSGIGLYLLTTGKKERHATNTQFVATPSSVPDGRGIVGLTKSGEQYTLNYVPITVPLADVVNAWLFCQSGQDVSLFDKHGGLFRGLDNDQLYKLYESENYYCGTYDSTQPTRPYLVTTDIFWELFAAAYEGLFIVKEREQAIPAFWKFVASANRHYKESNSQSQWKPVFEAVTDLRFENWNNPEAARIRAGPRSPVFQNITSRSRLCGTQAEGVLYFVAGYAGLL